MTHFYVGFFRAFKFDIEANKLSEKTRDYEDLIKHFSKVFEIDGFICLIDVHPKDSHIYNFGFEFYPHIILFSNWRAGRYGQDGGTKTT